MRKPETQPCPEQFMTREELMQRLLDLRPAIAATGIQCCKENVDVHIRLYSKSGKGEYHIIITARFPESSSMKNRQDNMTMELVHGWARLPKNLSDGGCNYVKYGRNNLGRVSDEKEYNILSSGVQNNVDIELLFCN